MQQSSAGVRPRPRIETLADLVFGLSLSIGSIALIANPPKSAGEITTHILAFAYTFFVLITAWLIYTTYMSVLPVETRTVTFLNVALLVLVAIVPYLLNGVEVANPVLTPDEVSMIQKHSSTLFALDLGGILLILATFAHVISLEEKKLVAPRTGYIIPERTEPNGYPRGSDTDFSRSRVLGVDVVRRPYQALPMVSTIDILLGRESGQA